MILHMFTVYDSKARAYLPPFFMQSKGAAIRSFDDSVNDPASAFHKHPEDYTLMELGTYDDSKAEFDLLEAHDALGCAIEFLNAAMKGDEQ